MGGDQSSWKGHSKSNWAVGGNVHLVGTPEQIVNWFIKLKKAGCDGMQINFFDFLPDLDFFGKRVMPLLHQAGLQIENALVVKDPKRIAAGFRQISKTVRFPRMIEFDRQTVRIVDDSAFLMTGVDHRGDVHFHFLRSLEIDRFQIELVFDHQRKPNEARSRNQIPQGR